MFGIVRESSRRKEIRRTKAERSSARLRRWRQVIFGPALTGAALLALLVGVLVNLGGSAFSLRVGQTLDRPLVARLPFSVFSYDATLERRTEARSASPSVFRLNVALVREVRETLATMTPLSDDASATQPTASPDAPPTAEQWATWIDAAIERLRGQPLAAENEAASRRSPRSVVLIDPVTGQERVLPRVERITDDSLRVALRLISEPFSAPRRDAVREALLSVIAPEGALRGFYVFDAATTTERATAAAAAIEPQYVEIPTNAVIVEANANGQVIVSRDDFDLARAEFDAYVARVNETAGWLSAAGGTIIGRGLLAFLATFGAALQYWLTGRQSAERMQRRLVTAGVLLLLVAVVRIIFVAVPSIPPHFAVGVQVLAAMLLSIVYHRQLSVYPGVVALALVLTLAVDQGLGFLFILLGASVVVVDLLSDVRSRGQVVGVGSLAATVALVLTAASGMIQGQTLSYLVWIAGWAAGTTLAAGFLIEGLLAGIERLFRVSTSMTLLEWCDASKPLMRWMAADAPGTYNHSLLVGALAENAAEAIGANALLSRAGAYYHDIGKINKPGYFVENQAMEPNRHDRLSPAMSLLIIIGHVKDGVEMAKEYNVPRSLHPFIAEHHGTTLVEYFFHAASKSRKPDDPVVSDTEYRYPGPKPQFRETAVVMLCDGVEGAVRAMAEPTPGRIEDVVDAIVQKRLQDGQFDECDLTFREIAMIRASLIKTLSAIYHSRITYPSSQPEKQPATA